MNKEKCTSTYVAQKWRGRKMKAYILMNKWSTFEATIRSWMTTLQCGYKNNYSKKSLKEKLKIPKAY